MSGHSSETNDILNAVSDGITINSQGVFVYVNETFAKMVGYDVHELIGMSAFSLVAPDYSEIVKDRTLNRQQGLDVVSIYELELVRRDGIHVPVEFHCSRIDYEGKSSSLTITRDISERKRLENELHSSEAYYQAVYENTGTTLILVDSDMTISRVNNQFEVLSGYSREEVEGLMKWTDFVTPEFLEMMKGYHRDRRTGGQVPSEYVCDLVNKSGEIRHVLIYVSLIPGSNQSAVSLIDITERVKLEEQLSAFISSATDSFSMLDEDMCFVEVNNNYLQVTGHKREDIIGKHLLDVYPELKETGQYDAYLKVLETGEPVMFRGVSSEVGGGKIYDVSAFKAGNVLGVTAMDVSDRMLYQKRLEALHVYGSKLSNAVSIEEVAKFTLDAVESVFGYQYSDFNIVQDDYLVPIQLVANNLRNNLDLHIDGPGIIVRAYRTGVSQLVHDTRLDEDYVDGRGEDTEWVSELAVPVKIEDEVVAVINVEHRELGAFNESDQKVIESLGMHVGSALSRLTRENVIKNTMEELRASELFLNQSQEIAHIGSWSTDLKTNQLTVSDEAYRIFGYVPQEIEVTYEVFLDAVHPEDRAYVEKEFSLSPEAGRSYEVVHRVIRLDGSVRWVRERSMGIFDESGVPVQSVGMIYDITDQVLADAELRTSEALFRGFMQSATERFVMFDETMRFIAVNASWLKRAGLKQKDVIGKHALEVFPELKETGQYDAYVKVLETGESVELRAVESVTKRGAILDITAFKTGNVLGITAMDVSERVLYQRRLELLHGHAAAMSQAESIKEVSEITQESLINVLGFNRGSLGLVEGSVLNHKYRWGIASSEEFKMPLDGPGVTVKVVNSGESIRIGNVSEAGLYVNGVGDPVTFSELAVPVTVSGRVVGVINIESNVFDAFSEDDQVLVETLASHVASAFSKIRYRERLSALHSFALELDLAESVENVVEISFHIMRDGLGLQYASFQLLMDEGLVTVGIDDMEFLDMVLPLSGKGITTRAAREARTVLLGDVRVDPDFVQGPSDSLSELAVPIMVEDRVLGVLNVESPHLDAFTVDDARLMEVLAQNVGATLFRLGAAEDKLELERQVLVQKVQVEQEQEIARMKTRFMSTATHELRTPLSSIMGYTELIQMDEAGLSDAQKQYFSVIQRNVQRLTKLTDDLLNQQRLEEGRLTLNLEPVTVKDMLQELRNEFTPILAVKHQTLRVNSVDVVVNMDQLRVMQVLVNLLSNASKFSPEGTEIVVDVVETGDGVQFSVSDQGVGIGEEDLGKLFTPFPGILVEGNVSGTGLGLSISKGIVELHGGMIWAESEGKGKGSTFSFMIPISGK